MDTKNTKESKRFTASNSSKYSNSKLEGKTYGGYINKTSQDTQKFSSVTLTLNTWNSSASEQEK